MLRKLTAEWVGEFVATFGLVGTILGCLKSRPQAVPYAVRYNPQVAAEANRLVRQFLREQL